MWERFSTSGLAGAYVDELLVAGIEARMEFRPRRALDPFPFLVSLAEDDGRDPFLSTTYCISGNAGDAQCDS